MLYRSQKLCVFSIYREEYNSGKYTSGDEVVFCHSKALTIEGYFFMKLGKGETVLSHFLFSM